MADRSDDIKDDLIIIYDIIIFGATGFTGKHCIPYIARLSKEKGKSLRWAISGRSAEKLKNVLKEMGEKTDMNLDDIPIILADANDQKSLINMTKQGKLILNCCGPFKVYGNAVVKACLETGTHHVDTSGEPDYMETIQLKYHDAAKEKGIYFISACGADSIPCDLGIVFLQQEFEGTLNSVDCFLSGGTSDEKRGNFINYGTWETIVHAVSNRSQLNAMRVEFYKKFKKPPAYEPKLKFKACPHKSRDGKNWVLPFLGSDRSVARRTQGYLYEHENLRPVQVGTYMLISSFFGMVCLLFYSAVFLLLSLASFGRKLLLDYPEFFSAGFFSKKEPAQEVIENTWFNIDFYGEGWKDKLANKDDQYNTPIDKTITGRVKGMNPGYGITCICLVLSSIVLLTETDKLAGGGTGGVYPPGAAFAKTSLINQLNENGVTFEVTKIKTTY